jgi:type I restriction enzyme, S subunit
MSYSNGYPLGAIKRLTKYKKGVVSTLYICFRINENNNPEFFEQYFESGTMNPEIEKIAQEGARNHGLLNMSVIDFFESVNIIVPSICEQRQIAMFLTAIDQKTSLVTIQLEKMQTWKKGLLQKTFV